MEKMGDSSKTFRYYSKRKPEEAISNHIVTLLLFDGFLVGYGHLDKEGGKVWLGVCVSEGYHGKGYGKKIMEKLISSYNGDIHLSVDKNNKKALSLYEKFSFKKVKKDDTVFYMKRDASSI